MREVGVLLQSGSRNRFHILIVVPLALDGRSGQNIARRTLRKLVPRFGSAVDEKDFERRLVVGVRRDDAVVDAVGVSDAAIQMPFHGRANNSP